MAAQQSPTVIATHSGSFHCDEALAVFLLKQLPEYKAAQVVRTRDPARIDQADIVVDVGGVYDPERHRYDHHQRTFTGTLDDEHDVKLSSAGLVYKHFGRRVIQEIVAATPNVPALADGVRETFFYRLYKSFVQAIDGIDNGVEPYTTDAPRNYKV